LHKNPIRQKSRETRGPAEYRGFRFGADPAESEVDPKNWTRT
jgi:hypothetical protein